MREIFFSVAAKLMLLEKISTGIQFLKILIRHLNKLLLTMLMGLKLLKNNLILNQLVRKIGKGIKLMDYT
jgi:hypothetical protein